MGMLVYRLHLVADAKFASLRQQATALRSGWVEKSAQIGQNW